MKTVVNAGLQKTKINVEAFEFTCSAFSSSEKLFQEKNHLVGGPINENWGPINEKSHVM